LKRVIKKLDELLEALRGGFFEIEGGAIIDETVRIGGMGKSLQWHYQCKNGVFEEKL
jgi:hypothetical protein